MSSVKGKGKGKPKGKDRTGSPSPGRTAKREVCRDYMQGKCSNPCPNSNDFILKIVGTTVTGLAHGGINADFDM